MIVANEIRGRLFPAVPVPFDRAGSIHRVAQERYAAWMSEQPIGGVALWAHTGRGLRLDEAARAEILGSWRMAMDRGRFVIAAAGGRPGAEQPGEVFTSARAMARHAADLGADALLVHPPVAFRGRSDSDTLVGEYHSAVAEAGLPLVLFYLYEAAGGVSYTPAVLAELLARPEVLGIKMATLDSVMTFQDVAQLVLTKAPEKVLITGEDRFLGYSLMSGAEAALIGMGAACTSLQDRLLQSHRAGRSAEFLALSAAVDDLARHTFRAPMEGYILRMLWCLVHHGVIPEEAANDPWGPPLDPSERIALQSCLERIPTT